MGKSWLRKRKLESELNSDSTTPEEKKALEEERHKLLQKLRRKTLRNKKNRKIRLQTAEKFVQQQQNVLKTGLNNNRFVIRLLLLFHDYVTMELILTFNNTIIIIQNKSSKIAITS